MRFSVNVICVRTHKLDTSHVKAQKCMFLQKLFAYTEKK